MSMPRKKTILTYAFEVIVAAMLSLAIYFSSSNVSILFAIECFSLFLFFEYLIFNQRDRFGPLSFFLLSLFLGVVDIMFVVLRVRTAGTIYDIGIYEKSLFIIIIWLISFCIAYGLWIKFKRKRNKEQKKQVKNGENFLSTIKKINVNSILIFGLAAQIFVFYKIITTIIAIGGFGEAINNFAIFRFNDQNYLLVFIYLLSFVPPALYEKGYKKTALVMLILNFIMITLTGRRGIAITTVIISTLVYVHYRIKPITNKTIILLALPVIIFVLMIGVFRGQNVSLSSDNGLILNTAAKVTNTVQYGDNVPDMINAVDSGDISFQGGKYLFNGIIGTVPRVMWAEKPEIDHSSISSQLVYHGLYSYGRPVGAFGFAYLCFGYVGVVLSGLICGFLTALFYWWAVKKGQTIVSVLIYAITIQFVMSITNPESQVKILFIFVILIAMKIFDSGVINKITVRRKKDDN